jgi:HD-GYP domain-containing protein (c-di-GMP phosphodiesterase class II)
MGELLLTVDAIEREIKKGKSFILVESIRDNHFNVLIGTERILTEKDIQKIRERTPEWLEKPVLVRTAIPHYVDDEKRVKWSAYVISLFEGSNIFKKLPREKKDFVIKYIKTILLENDYLIWKLSQIKAYSQKVFDHSINTCFIAIVIYYGYSFLKLSGMVDAKTIERAVEVSLLHNLGLLKMDPAVLEKKRIEIAPMRTDPFYHHTIEAYKLIKSESEKHELCDDVLEAILNNEEFIDGSGGPRGIGGNDLSFVARIVSISSYFDQLLAGEWSFKERSYRDFLAKLRVEKDKFDPGLMEALYNSFTYLVQI